jgi:hypothetical protein
MMMLLCVLCMKCMRRTDYGLVVSVCPHISTRVSLGGLGRNFVWVLCHWVLPQNRTFEYSTIGGIKTVDEEICEVGSTIFQ